MFNSSFIKGMLFVNYGGGHYWFFDHARWHGLTVADLVMPWFIFILGTSQHFSMKKLNQQNSNLLQKINFICLRSVKLFLLGAWIVNVNLSYSTFRVPGLIFRKFRRIKFQKKYHFKEVPRSFTKICDILSGLRVSRNIFASSA